MSKDRLNTESKGKLIIDIEKYDEEQAKVNHKIRQNLFIELRKAEARQKAKKTK